MEKIIYLIEGTFSRLFNILWADPLYSIIVFLFSIGFVFLPSVFGLLYGVVATRYLKWSNITHGLVYVSLIVIQIFWFIAAMQTMLSAF